MKKLNILRIFFCFSFITIGSSLKAQSDDFIQDQSAVQVGYGFGNLMQGVFEAYTAQVGYSNSAVGPMFLKYEYAISDKLGFGLNIAYASTTADYKETYYDNNSNQSHQYNAKIKYNAYSFLARINWHFGNSKKFDPYWGIGLGYRSYSFKYTSDAPDYADDEGASFEAIFPLGFEATVGARYLFTDNFGVYAETGLAKAVVQFGLVLRLK